MINAICPDIVIYFNAKKWVVYLFLSSPHPLPSWAGARYDGIIVWTRDHSIVSLWMKKRYLSVITII